MTKGGAEAPHMTKGGAEAPHMTKGGAEAPPFVGNCVPDRSGFGRSS
jgi:hypothetical protein